MGRKELEYILPLARSLREAGIATEIYPDQTKLKKQFDYADRKCIPFISINGESEMEQGLMQIKKLSSGEQKQFAKDDLEGILSFLG